METWSAPSPSPSWGKAKAESVFQCLTVRVVVLVAGGGGSWSWLKRSRLFTFSQGGKFRKLSKIITCSYLVIPSPTSIILFGNFKIFTVSVAECLEVELIILEEFFHFFLFQCGKILLGEH